MFQRVPCQFSPRDRDLWSRWDESRYSRLLRGGGDVQRGMLRIQEGSQARRKSATWRRCQLGAKEREMIIKRRRRLEWNRRRKEGGPKGPLPSRMCDHYCCYMRRWRVSEKQHSLSCRCSFLRLAKLFRSFHQSPVVMSRWHVKMKGNRQRRKFLGLAWNFVKEKLGIRVVQDSLIDFFQRQAVCWYFVEK